MPIQKSKDLPNGVTADYWRVVSIQIDISKLAEPYPTTFILGLFLNKDASDTGKAPLIKKKSYTFEFTRAELISGALVALGQAKILAKSNTLIDPIFPSTSTDQVYFDPDLAEGTIVT